jgi:hypothetical protein
LSRTCTALSIAVLLAFGANAAEVVPLTEVVPLNEAVDVLSVELSESGPDRTVIEYRLGSFTTDIVEIGGEAYHTVTLGGESHLLSKGLPGLPNVARSIVIPDDAEMSVRVISSHYVDYHDIDVAPSKGEIPRTIDPAGTTRSVARCACTTA